MAELSTLPEDLTQVTIEALTDLEPVETYSVPIADFSEEDIQFLNEREYLDNLSDSLGNFIEADQVLAAPAAAGQTLSFTNNDFIFTINFNGTDYRVLFPETSRDTLVIRDNILINLSGSSISGLVLSSGDTTEVTGYHVRYVTLLPFTNSSSNSTVYRNGGYAYLTTYSAYSSTQLTSVAEYFTPVVTKKNTVFSGFSSFQMIMIIIGVLIVILNVFRGLRND